MTTTDLPTETRPHPAKFSEAHLQRAQHYLAAEAERTGRERLRVLDPCAGVGTFHDLPHETVGVELEPEWALARPRTYVGDSTDLSWLDTVGEGDPFDAVFTSYAYANRMADTYDGSGDRCTTAGCGKDGAPPGSRLATDDDPIEETDELAHQDDVNETVVVVDCQDCEGTGRRPSKRMTYRICLGRMPSENSTAVEQWGPEYRRLHRLITTAAVGQLRHEGLAIVNVSNHVRTVGSGANRRETFPPVVEFHLMTLCRAGMYLVAAEEIETRGYGFGQNSKVRVAAEHLLVFRKGQPRLRRATEEPAS